MDSYDREFEFVLLNLTTRSLEMLMRVDMVVEGILRLLFAAVYLMFNKVSNDNEVSAASRYDSFSAAASYISETFGGTWFMLARVLR